MADRITLSITPKDRTLTKDFSTISYVFGFYNEDELSQFNTDLKYCEEQGWVEPTGIDDYNRSQGFIEGRSSVWLDVSTNTFYQYYVGINLQQFLDYFIHERKNFEPITRYFEQNPDKGSINIIIQ